MRAIADGDGNQAIIAPDTMVLVDNEVTRRQRGQFGQESVRRLAPLLATHKTVAKHVLFAQHHKVGRGIAMVQRQNDHGGLASGDAQGLLPTIDCDNRRCLMLCQQPLQPFARAT